MARRKSSRTSAKGRGPLPRAKPAGPRARGKRPAAARRRAPAPSRRARPGAPSSVGLAEAPARLPETGEREAQLGKYVYCVIPSSAPFEFGALGLGHEPSHVYTVNYRDLAAVVSDTPVGIQDPTRENVVAHQRVNEAVMRRHTVLPMSFGTVFKTQDDIVELLRSAYEAFADVLAKIQGNVEYGLKVLWDRDQMVDQIESEDEDILRLKAEISLRAGSTYFARMQYGRMIDGALERRADELVQEIFETLRDVSVAGRSNKPIGDKMIMNSAFLVARDQETAFDAHVKSLGARYPSLTFKYTGPWPPYNFVNIRLKFERAD